MSPATPDPAFAAGAHATETLLARIAQLEGRERALDEALSRTQAELEALQDFIASTEVAGLFLDQQLQVERVTASASQLLGIGDADQGRHCRDLDHPLLQADLLAQARAVLAGHSPAGVELRTDDGRWIYRQVRPYRSRRRDLLGVVIVFGDVTALREANEALDVRNQQLELAWVAARGGVYEHSIPPDDSTYVSNAWARVLGYQPEALPGGASILDWLAAQIHPDDIAGLDEAFGALVEGRRDEYAVELRVRHQNGHWTWVRSLGRVAERDLDGRVRRVLRMMIDIDESKRAEASLRESESRFRTMSDQIPQLAWMADGEGWIFWYNQRWFDYTGTTLEQMAGWGWRSVHHADHVDRVVAKISDHFRTGEPWEDTFPLRGADGRYRWFLSRAQPIRASDGSGRVERWFGTNTDITNQLEIERRLIDADRQKDEFLAMLGHELRNPLGAVRVATEMLSRSLGDVAGAAKPLDVLSRQTAHMGKLLDGLLDVSRIVSGHIDLRPEPVEIGALLRSFEDEVKLRCTHRQLQVVMDRPAQPIHVRADPARLWQMVDNLLSNAIKYTPDGGCITVQVHDAPSEQVVLSIADTGIGIDPELLPYIFEKFRQSPRAIDRAEGGLGLGLALVRQLAVLHGGRIEAFSAGPRMGARFELTLPRADSPSVADALPAAADSGPTHVLLIEDHADAADMLGQLLEMIGFRVSVAHDGPEGLRVAGEIRPDCIVCDLGLPGGLSGFDVAERLRENPETVGIRLIALSGYGRAEDKAHSLAAGFDHHLTKPVDTTVLLSLLKTP